MIKFLCVVCVIFSMVMAPAHANTRAGSGRSVGQQSTNVTNRNVAPNAPAAAPAATKPAVPAAVPPAAAVPPSRPWGAMLGGVAAGMGMAWLAHSLGLGAAMGSVLMFVLLGLAVCAVVVWWMQRRIRRHEQSATV